jgi:hypothetical protein
MQNAAPAARSTKSALLAAAGYTPVPVHPVLAARAIRAANTNGSRAQKAVRHG